MLNKLRFRNASRKIKTVKERISVLIMFLTVVNMSSLGVFFIAPAANATSSVGTITLESVSRQSGDTYKAIGKWDPKGNQCWNSGSSFKYYISIFDDKDNDGLLDTGENLGTITPAPCNGDFSSPVDDSNKGLGGNWPASGQSGSTFNLNSGRHKICAILKHSTPGGNDSVSSCLNSANGGATISGYKYLSSTNPYSSSSLTPGAGVTINLKLASTSAIVKTTSTASDGYFVFDKLADGLYNLEEIVKTGWIQLLHPTSSIQLWQPKLITGNNFINYEKQCGNSVTDAGEQCDAGSENGIACTADYNGSCDYCSALCQTASVTGPYCGDNTKNGDEECDNKSGLGENQLCSATCTIINLPFCGDNSVNQTIEQCDGNTISNAECNSSCQIICNSGYHLNDALSCIPNTPEPFCGDSNIDTSLEEECDAGAGNGTLCSATYDGTCDYCTNLCKTATLNGPACGDGFVDSKDGEQCDDNNLAAGDGCSATCKWETNNFECSAKPENSVWNSVGAYTQTCASSNGKSCTTWSPIATSTIYSLDTTTTACHFTCSEGFAWNGETCIANEPVCGNELTETGEQCDDGNVVSGDGCSADCTIENNNEVTYGWNTSEWGSCSVSCGGGTQTRTATCINNSKETVADSFCNSETKPSLSQPCNTQSCGGGGGGGGSYIGFAITNPQITMTCVDSKVNMTMTWLTSFAANSRVIFDTVSHSSLGVLPNYGYASSTPLDASQVTGHSVSINGLTPNTPYYLRPISTYNNADVVGEEKVLTQTLNCSTGATPNQVIVLGEEGAPKLSISNKVLSPYANPGTKGVEFELSVTNNGNLSSFNTTLKHVLPAGLTFSDTNKQEQTWNLGDIAPGESKTIKVKTDVAKETSAKNLVTQAYASSDNNEVVSASSSLEIRKISVLAETGFNPLELAGLASILLLSLGFGFFLEKRLNENSAS